MSGHPMCLTGPGVQAVVTDFIFSGLRSFGDEEGVALSPIGCGRFRPDSGALWVDISLTFSLELKRHMFLRQIDPCFGTVSWFRLGRKAGVFIRVIATY